MDTFLDGYMSPIACLYNQQLPKSDQLRDLGIIITNDFKWRERTDKSCKTANRILRLIDASTYRISSKVWVGTLLVHTIRQDIN